MLASGNQGPTGMFFSISGRLGSSIEKKSAGGFGLDRNIQLCISGYLIYSRVSLGVSGVSRYLGYLGYTQYFG